MNIPKQQCGMLECTYLSDPDDLVYWSFKEQMNFDSYGDMDHSCLGCYYIQSLTIPDAY